MAGTLTVVSGGQTGVDRAALDTALGLGLPCGGNCPRDRRAEDGPIPPHYPLHELESADYADRTRQNVLDTEATLIITRGKLSGGTALTLQLACQAQKPCLVIDLTRNPDPLEAIRWISTRNIEVLNIAGPRESSLPGIYHQAASWLEPLLKPFCRDHS